MVTNWKMMKKLIFLILFVYANGLAARTWSEWQSLDDGNLKLLQVSYSVDDIVYSHDLNRYIFRFRHTYRQAICATIKIIFIDENGKQSKASLFIKKLEPNEVSPSDGNAVMMRKLIGYDVFSLNTCDNVQKTVPNQIEFKKKNRSASMQPNKYEATANWFYEQTIKNPPKALSEWDVPTGNILTDKDGIKYTAKYDKNGKVESVTVTDANGNQVYRKEYTLTQTKVTNNANKSSENYPVNAGKILYTYFKGSKCSLNQGVVYISNILRYTVKSDNSDMRAAERISEDLKRKGMCNMKAGSGSDTFNKESEARDIFIQQCKEKSLKIVFINLEESIN